MLSAGTEQERSHLKGIAHDYHAMDQLANVVEELIFFF